MSTIINIIGATVVLILVVFDLVLNDERDMSSGTTARVIFELIILAILLIFNLVEAM